MSDNTPYDGVDRCRWLGCYAPSHRAGAEFCARHEDSPGAAALANALHAAADIYGL